MAVDSSGDHVFPQEVPCSQRQKQAGDREVGEEYQPAHLVLRVLEL